MNIVTHDQRFFFTYSFDVMEFLEENGINPVTDLLYDGFDESYSKYYRINKKLWRTLHQYDKQGKLSYVYNGYFRKYLEEWPNYIRSIGGIKIDPENGKRYKVYRKTFYFQDLEYQYKTARKRERKEEER